MASLRMSFIQATLSLIKIEKSFIPNAVILRYLLGALPSAYFIGRSKHSYEKQPFSFFCTFFRGESAANFPLPGFFGRTADLCHKISARKKDRRHKRIVCLSFCKKSRPTVSVFLNLPTRSAGGCPPFGFALPSSNQSKFPDREVCNPAARAGLPREEV